MKRAKTVEVSRRDSDTVEQGKLTCLRKLSIVTKHKLIFLGGVALCQAMKKLTLIQHGSPMERKTLTQIPKRWTIEDEECPEGNLWNLLEMRSCIPL